MEENFVTSSRAMKQTPMPNHMHAELFSRTNNNFITSMFLLWEQKQMDNNKEIAPIEKRRTIKSNSLLLCVILFLSFNGLFEVHSRKNKKSWPIVI